VLKFDRHLAWLRIPGGTARDSSITTKKNAQALVANQPLVPVNNRAAATASKVNTAQQSSLPERKLGFHGLAVELEVNLAA
jgi:hypothetical protein